MRPTVPRIIRDNNGNPLGVVQRVRFSETALCAKCSKTYTRETTDALPATMRCERCR